MRMTSDWFAAAKAYRNLPSLGRSVHHVRGYRLQLTLTLQVHRKRGTSENWEFEVLTKMGVVQKHRISDESLAHAIEFLEPSFGTLILPMSQRVS